MILKYPVKSFLLHSCPIGWVMRVRMYANRFENSQEHFCVEIKRLLAFIENFLKNKDSQIKDYAKIRNKL